MNIFQWKQQINDFNTSFEQNREVWDQWNVNTRLNLHRFCKSNSIWNLQNDFLGAKEKAFLLVGASPCLKRDVKFLQDLNDNYRILCSNSSLRFLLQNDVRPDYCICLDSDEIDIPQHLDCDNADIVLLASSVVSPKSLEKWQGPIWFIPYYAIDKELRPKVRRKLGRKVPSGGNSITEALVIVTLILGSQTVIFVANEYCFDKSYYADSTAAKQEKLQTLLCVKDVQGRDRWSLNSLYVYATWTDKICADLTPPGFFIDTSFGLLGKDSAAIHVMPLSDALLKVRWAFAFRDRLNAAPTALEKAAIIDEMVPRNDNKSDVRRYDMQAQRERMLQLARS